MQFAFSQRFEMVVAEQGNHNGIIDLSVYTTVAIGMDEHWIHINLRVNNHANLKTISASKQANLIS